MKNFYKKYLNKFKRKVVFPIVHEINKEKILNHRLFFCINSGRSGSEYLATLLGTAKEVESYHEPNPNMSGFYVDLVNKQNYSETYSTRYLKNLAIKNQLLKLPEEKVYCETNHMFIKTFFDVIVNDFNQMEVIILRRYLPNVLKSFIQLGYFSEKSWAWPLWMSSPNAITAGIKCIDSDENLDQYDLCIGYLIDIEARALRFKQQYPWIKTHEVRLELLNDFERVKNLFAELDITPTAETHAIHSKKINQKKELKEKKSKSQRVVVDLEYCQERINQYILKAESLGIEVPKTLALNPE